MRIRSIGLVAVATMSIVVTACSSGSGSSASAGASAAAPSATPNPCAGAAAHSGDKITMPTDTSKIKIGVAADVGKIDDKNFNEYTYKGATEAAKALGIPGDVPFVTPTADTDRIPNLQKYVDQGFNIIVTAGFANGTATGCMAKVNPDVWFVGVDQGPPAPGSELPNYIQLSYQEDQAGYLAGIVAAAASKKDAIGAIGGITLCGPCVRYIQGYELGAKSVKPDIKVETLWVTESDFNKAFNDPTTGKADANQMISQKGVDVLFQVAGKTGNGVLEAACDNNILAVGVDVDQALSNPDTAKCTVTSATKSLTTSVQKSIADIVAGTAKGGDSHWDAKNDGIGAAPFHDLASAVPADTQAKLDAALAAMKAGTLKTCPSKAAGDAVDCGSLK